MNYLINEEESLISFAAINNIDEGKTLKNKVVLAVKEEWGYDKVELVLTNKDKKDFTVFTFNCTTENDDEETRKIRLIPTAIY